MSLIPQPRKVSHVNCFVHREGQSKERILSECQCKKSLSPTSILTITPMYTSPLRLNPWGPSAVQWRTYKPQLSVRWKPGFLTFSCKPEESGLRPHGGGTCIVKGTSVSRCVFGHTVIPFRGTPRVLTFVSDPPKTH